MSWSRREFIVTSSLAAAAGTLQQVNVFGQQQPAGAPPPPAVPKFEPLRRNMGIFTARGGTIGWLVAPDAVLVIDSQFADTAQMFLDGLKPRTQRKIRSPHQHAPSPGPYGGQQDAAAICHQDRGARQRARPPAQAGRGPEDGSQPGLRRHDLQRRLEARHWQRSRSAKDYGPGHTSGDGVIFFERANIVHMGDLMSHQRHPRIDARPAHRFETGWSRSKRSSRITAPTPSTSSATQKWERRSPGSGKDLLAVRDYFSAMLDYVQKGIAAGKSAEEITKGTLPAYADDEGMPQLQVAYDELTAKA